MKKVRVFGLVIVYVGLFLSSCHANQNYRNILTSVATVSSTLSLESSSTLTSTSALTTTPTPKPVITFTLIPSHTSTPSIAPTRTPYENPGLVVTLGEVVNREGWWPAIPAFSPDGKMIALASEKIRLWDIQSHSLVHELIRPYSVCYTRKVSFSPDSYLLAVSIECISDYENPGHLLIWDTKTGDLLHDWGLGYTKNTSTVAGVSNKRVPSGIAFFPSSSQIAYGNGNTVEIQDIWQGNESVLIKLGDNMFASDLAISGDGKTLYAFMDFDYYNAPATIAKKYAVQIWNIEAKSLRQRLDYPIITDWLQLVGHPAIEMGLTSRFLTRIDYVNCVFKVINLETGEMKKLPFRKGEVFLSFDSSFILYFPELDGFYCKNQSIELWNAETGQNRYTFVTYEEDFGATWCFGPHTAVFNPTNTLLAIAHEERVSIWDISGVTVVQQSTTP